jgi:hypothetical protein
MELSTDKLRFFLITKSSEEPKLIVIQYKEAQLIEQPKFFSQRASNWLGSDDDRG